MCLQLRTYLNTFAAVLAFHSIPEPLLIPVDKKPFIIVSTLAKEKVISHDLLLIGRKIAKL